RSLICDSEVAGQYDLGSPAEGVAIDRGDDRLGNPVPHDAGESPLWKAGRRNRSAARDLLEVGAGAKCAPGSGDHNGTHLIVSRRLLESMSGRTSQVGIHGVEHLRSVQGDDGYGATPFVKNG